MSPAHWRLTVDPPASGAVNMARDAAAMASSRADGAPRWRIYRWERPTISFGRHESARGYYAAERLTAAGVDAVRRPTGGRALLHDHELTYCVTERITEGESLRASVARFNAILLDALHRLDVPAVVVGRDGAPLRPVDGAPCFTEPGEGEIALDGRKLVGSAQQRDDGALLQHGSIILADDQPRLATLATTPIARAAPAATLMDARGIAPTVVQLIEALRNAITAAAVRATGAPPIEAPSATTPELLAHYADPDWTWRH
ncbi:MAG: hypothetical protein K2X99_05305 [Gemmatimonadaceae bacterium]|nr:hypothetical protein [Gemmatimonadaceae bacterium]